MRVKGSAIVARREWLREQGVGAYERVLSALSPATREAVEGAIASIWVDFDHFTELCEVADRVLGTGDHRIGEEMARDAAERNLTTLYRLFFKVGRPAYILEKSASMWRTIYDTGNFRVERLSASEVRATLEGIPRPHRAHCVAVLAWAIRALELSGARDVQAEERCRLLGDAECSFHVRWR
ncbi:MAG: hypothetical protein D6729_04270 [Deltaproteobacteria bacterium]|nr:MAG: hypothetical protein D6729_04270 [Deltaproteobacteria bacterium]